MQHWIIAAAPALASAYPVFGPPRPRLFAFPANSAGRDGTVLETFGFTSSAQ